MSRFLLESCVSEKVRVSLKSSVHLWLVRLVGRLLTRLFCLLRLWGGRLGRCSAPCCCGGRLGVWGGITVWRKKKKTQNDKAVVLYVGQINVDDHDSPIRFFSHVCRVRFTVSTSNSSDWNSSCMHVLMLNRLNYYAVWTSVKCQGAWLECFGDKHVLLMEKTHTHRHTKTDTHTHRGVYTQTCINDCVWTRSATITAHPEIYNLPTYHTHTHKKNTHTPTYPALASVLRVDKGKQPSWNN